MKFCQISFYVSREESELAAYIAQGVTNQSVALYDREDLKELNIEFIEESVKNALPLSCLVKCFCEPSEKDKLAAELKEKLSAAFLRDIELYLEIIDDKSYINKWKEDFKPLSVKDLIVMPKGYEGKRRTRSKFIEIDTSMAFGTGKHETTYLMLKLLQEIDLKDKSFLDVGCGSGILSIAAAALGAKNVLALDLDDECINTARKNAQDNGFGEKIKVIKSNLTQGVKGRYDTVAANITLDILKLLYADIDKFTKNGGYLLLSGVLKEQGKELKRLFGKKFTFIKSRSKGIWSIFLFKV